MAGKKSEEKRAYGQEMLDRQAESGLSVRRFCAKERVSEASFYMWRRKLGGCGNSHRRAESASRHADGSANGREFIPLRLLDASGSIEVIHPLGYRIQVTGDVNGESLQRILDVLDARSGS